MIDESYIEYDPTLAQEIMLRVVKSSVSGCWEWTGMQQRGTPKLYWKKRSLSVRRLITRTATRLSSNVLLWPTCGNQACVNPGHTAMGERGQFLTAMRLRQPNPPACVKGHPFKSFDYLGRRMCDVCAYQRRLRYRNKMGTAKYNAKQRAAYADKKALKVAAI